MRVARAFTLAEVLVAAAVLVLMAVLLFRVLSSVSSVALCSWEHRACDRQAGIVFEQLAQDLNSMVRRADMDTGFEKRQGNDALSFYAEVAGYGADDTHPQISLLAYRVQQGSPAMHGLVRGARNCDWVSVIYAGAGSSSVTPPNHLPGIQAEDCQSLASNVCRMEFWFQLKDGSISESWRKPEVQHQLSAASAPTAYDDATRGYKPGSWWVEKGVAQYVCCESSPGRAQWCRASGIGNIAAIVVALAVIEVHGQEAPDLEAVANVLQDFDGDGALLARWQEQLEKAGPEVLQPGILRAVRFYERVFYPSPL